MKLYSFAICALCHSSMGFNWIRNAVTTGSLLASSDDEALGKALNYARQHFKSSDGYHAHEAVVERITDDVVRAAAKELS